MNVHALPSLRLKDAEANLKALTDRARKLAVFGPTVDFDSPVWDLSLLKPARPTASSSWSSNLYFTTAENRCNKGLDGRTPLAPKFSDFLKALVVLREHSRPCGTQLHRTLIRAARPLHDALRDRQHDPVLLTTSDFKRAAEAIGKTNAATTCYRLGQNLEDIAASVNRHGLAKATIVFANPFPRVTYDTTRISEAARAERAERMASGPVMRAIADVSLIVREVGNDRDILLSSAVDFLASAPWRINDALNVQIDCERKETFESDDGPKECLGIAYRGSKGVAASIKWVPTDMKVVAERALADIKRITEPTRAVARFMEQHPGRAWLHGSWRLRDPDTLATTQEVADMLGLGSSNSASAWLRDKVAPVGKRVYTYVYRLADVERAVLSLQPKLPPGSPPLSSYLFIVPRNFFNPTVGQILPIVSFLTDHTLSWFIGGREDIPSIFERLDIRDENGEPHGLTSHQIRHFLNTLAQEGGLSQLDIARWSGRKDVRENVAYDHTGGVHLARKMREVLSTGAMEGPIAQTAESLPPADRKAFVESRLATVHMTDIGACIQDWSLAPCAKHGSCASCSEHLVIKGDATQKARAEQLLKDYEPLVAEAERERQNGTYGAGPWVEHNRKMVDGLERIIAVHDDASIPDGTPVQSVGLESWNEKD